MDSSNLILESSRNLYICHRWHYDTPWVNFVAMIDTAMGDGWRNWSLPWHDPSLERNEIVGATKLNKMLRGQIANAELVFLLQDIADLGGQRAAWLPIQVEIARQLEKPIIGVGGVFGKAVAPEWNHFCIKSVPFAEVNVRALLEEGF